MNFRSTYRTLADFPKTLRWLARHPLTRRRLVPALADFVRWQVGSRLVPGAVLVPLVDGARLAIEPGMRGATGAVYSGLHEFEDMAFVLHCLRPGDLFVDVGANVGSYAILAAAGAGADVLALEPGEVAFERLHTNVMVNDVAGRVRTIRAAVGDRVGRVRITCDADTMNQVAEAPGLAQRPTDEVPLVTLDSVLDGQKPTVIKIDVEGYEGFVLRGAEKTLGDSSLLALVVEVNDACRAFGDTEDAFVRNMLGHGFRPFAYEPWARELSPLSGTNPDSNNTIFLRDLAGVKSRIESAKQFGVRGQLV